MKNKLCTLIIIMMLGDTPQGQNEPHTANRLVLEKQADTNYLYAITIIKKWETLSPARYQLFNDTYIGYGHMLYASDTITLINQLMAESLLHQDFNNALGQVNLICPKLPQNRKYVLAMFVFNCGIRTLLKSKLLKNIDTGAPDSVLKKQYLSYVFAGKRRLPKLRLRRIDEFALW